MTAETMVYCDTSKLWGTSAHAKEMRILALQLYFKLVCTGKVIKALESSGVDVGSVTKNDIITLADIFLRDGSVSSDCYTAKNHDYQVNSISPSKISPAKDSPKARRVSENDGSLPKKRPYKKSIKSEFEEPPAKCKKVMAPGYCSKFEVVSSNRLIHTFRGFDEDNCEEIARATLLKYLRYFRKVVLLKKSQECIKLWIKRVCTGNMHDIEVVKSKFAKHLQSLHLLNKDRSLSFSQKIFRAIIYSEYIFLQVKSKAALMGLKEKDKVEKLKSISLSNASEMDNNERFNSLNQSNDSKIDNNKTLNSLNQSETNEALNGLNNIHTNKVSNTKASKNGVESAENLTFMISEVMSIKDDSRKFGGVNSSEFDNSNKDDSNIDNISVTSSTQDIEYFDDCESKDDINLQLPAPAGAAASTSLSSSKESSPCKSVEQDDKSKILDDVLQQYNNVIKRLQEKHKKEIEQMKRRQMQLENNLKLKESQEFIANLKSEPVTPKKPIQMLETKEEPDLDVVIETKAHIDTDPELHMDIESDTHIDTESDAHVDVESDTHMDAEPEPHIDTEPEPHIDTEPEPHIDTEPDAHVDANPNGHIDTEPNRNKDAEPDTLVDTELEKQMEEQCDSSDIGDYVDSDEEINDMDMDMLMKSTPVVSLSSIGNVDMNQTTLPSEPGPSHLNSHKETEAVEQETVTSTAVPVTSPRNVVSPPASSIKTVPAVTSPRQIVDPKTSTGESNLSISPPAKIVFSGSSPGKMILQLTSPKETVLSVSSPRKLVLPVTSPRKLVLPGTSPSKLVLPGTSPRKLVPLLPKQNKVVSPVSQPNETVTRTPRRSLENVPEEQITTKLILNKVGQCLLKLPPNISVDLKKTCREMKSPSEVSNIVDEGAPIMHLTKSKLPVSRPVQKKQGLESNLKLQGVTVAHKRERPTIVENNVTSSKQEDNTEEVLVLDDQETKEDRVKLASNHKTTPPLKSSFKMQCPVPTFEQKRYSCKTCSYETILHEKIVSHCRTHIIQRKQKVANLAKNNPVVTKDMTDTVKPTAQYTTSTSPPCDSTQPSTSKCISQSTPVTYTSNFGETKPSTKLSNAVSMKASSSNTEDSTDALMKTQVKNTTPTNKPPIVSYPFTNFPFTSTKFIAPIDEFERALEKNKK